MLQPGNKVNGKPKKSLAKNSDYLTDEEDGYTLKEKTRIEKELLKLYENKKKKRQKLQGKVKKTA
jgi:hypothetical protein